jgi:hypothetical protein
MLCRGCDRFVSHLRGGRWAEELAARVVEESEGLGGHGEGRSGRGWHRRARPVPARHTSARREAADDLHAPAGPAQGALDEVRSMKLEGRMRRQWRAPETEEGA